MLFKKITTSALLAAGLALSSAAMAGNALTIVNNTDYYSTSKINRGACSTILGEKLGTTKPHDTNTVPSDKIWIACIADHKNCKAEVYMKKDCEGDVVATAVFDTDKGIKEIKMAGHGFNISGSGFTVIIDGGPAASAGK